MTHSVYFVVGVLQTTALGYDRNGNRSYTLTATQADVYTYNGANQLQAIARNSVLLESYRYDETGQRLQKTNNGVTTTYVNPTYEVTAGVATQYYNFNSQRIALRKNGVLTYLHADHLGSTQFATDANGTVVSNNQPRYTAYGRERIASVAALPTDYTFTGQKLDGTGLIYMNARYYDPQLGTFISPDPLVPDATSLADYNRYLYAQGNPMRYTDPSGHDGWDILVNTYFAVTDFGFGVGAQVGYNTTSIVLPGEYNSLVVQSSESTAKIVGRHVGNVISLAQAAGEIAGGAGMAGGGVAICVTAVGCLATPVVTAAGVAVGVHGVAVGASALYEEGRLLNNVVMSVAGDESGSSTRSGLFDATQAADQNGFTRAGRALQKHGNRTGSAWEKFLQQVN